MAAFWGKNEEAQLGSCNWLEQGRTKCDRTSESRCGSNLTQRTVLHRSKLSPVYYLTRREQVSKFIPRRINMMRVTMLGYLFALLCSLLGMLHGSSSPGVDAACATARVRKNYDSLTLAERQLYRNALQLAMDRGHYIKFVEMHMEQMSEMEAHRVCMFTYWHRYFLLGFENMLRSLDPIYECLTIPYWDQMQQSARALTGACTSIESCALIARDMGGSSIGTSKGVSINGAWVSGDLCVSAAPFNHFCENSSKTGSACAKCLPRSNLKAKSFQPASNFVSVYRQLFQSGGFTATGANIESGMHNAMHAELGGAMGTFQSPADPLFWSHHAYVDLLLTVYLKCRVGLNVLTNEQKKNNAYAFVQCPQRDGVNFFTAASNVTMRSGEVGKTAVRVDLPANQQLFPFFQSLPAKYYQLSDVTQLGANKYTYQVGGLVGQMASQCDAATGKVRRRLKRKSHKDCSSDLNDDGPALPRGLPKDHSDDNDESAKKVNEWVADVRKKLGPVDEAHAVEQLEKMVCMFYDQCRGGVNDYSDEFKKAFNVNEPPPCKRIIDAIKAANGSDPNATIALPDWKERMTKLFPCNVATQGAYGSSS